MPEGTTLPMVAHETAFARRASGRVFMHVGRIHETGPPQGLSEAPLTPELRPFLSALPRPPRRPGRRRSGRPRCR